MKDEGEKAKNTVMASLPANDYLFPEIPKPCFFLLLFLHPSSLIPHPSSFITFTGGALASRRCADGCLLFFTFFGLFRRFTLFFGLSMSVVIGSIPPGAFELKTCLRNHFF